MFSLISIDKSSLIEEKSPKAVCVCVFQIHSRVPSLALFTRPAEWSRRCSLPHCKEEPQAEVHFFIKTPSREELQRGWQLLRSVPIQDSLGTHLDHDVYLVLEILCRPSCAWSLWEKMLLIIGLSCRLYLVSVCVIRDTVPKKDPCIIVFPYCFSNVTPFLRSSSEVFYLCISVMLLEAQNSWELSLPSDSQRLLRLVVLSSSLAQCYVSVFGHMDCSLVCV